jgi:hypothetical protein
MGAQLEETQIAVNSNSMPKSATIMENTCHLDWAKLIFSLGKGID